MRKTLYPESIVQKNGLKWLGYAHPQVRKCVIKIDNEGKRTPQGHQLAAALGLHVGASDLFVAYPCHGKHGLWAEVKKLGFKVVPSNEFKFKQQMDFIYKMREQGYAAEMCVGYDQLIKAFQDYLDGKL